MTLKLTLALPTEGNVYPDGAIALAASPLESMAELMQELEWPFEP